MRNLLLLTTVFFIMLECEAQQVVGANHDVSGSLRTGEVKRVQGLKTDVRNSRDRVLDSLSISNDQFAAAPVYSEKQWTLFRDSLFKIPGVNIPSSPDSLLRHKEVSEDEFVRAVNRRFFSMNDTVRQLPTQPGLSKDLFDENLDQVPALHHITLPAHRLQNLPPLSGNIIDAQYLQPLDSIRDAHLKEERLKLHEKKTSTARTLAEVGKRPNILDRFYFEGILGISGRELTILQVSPAFGYHVGNTISVGLGPSILIQEESSKLVAAVGARSFVKAELAQRKVYLQVEDVMGPYTSNTNSEKKNIFQQHRVYAGGGYLVSLTTPVTLNLALLYNVNHRSFPTEEFSPWLFRIGVSIIKPKGR